MDRVFPFGFPSATAWYLTLYVLTLVVHVVFMHYVLAGTAWMAVSSIMRQRESSMVRILRAWMPAALSAAITAGVAPLLFVQILYKHSFYSANLLLFNRWMSILPVLIVGFYLLYLAKSRRVMGWPVVLRTAVLLAAFGCFAFTGYSWTENHILSLRGSQWPDVFVQDSLFYSNREILPRLALWFAGSVATLVTMVGWQLRHEQQRTIDDSEMQTPPRIPAMAALVGIGISMVFGIVCFVSLDSYGRSAVTDASAIGYLLLATGGLGLQGYAWWRQRADATWQRRWLGLATAGTLVTIIGMSVVRECLRISRLDFPSLYAEHDAAAGKSGLFVFLLFTVINAIAIAWCIWIVGRKRTQQTAD